MPTTATIAYVALGANLGEARAALAEAQARLQQPGIRVRRRARLYRSAPVGPQDQPAFFNTVVEVETDLHPDALLARLKDIEETMGRTKTVRWGPRVIDLDIVLYGDAEVAEDHLVIPHREMANRAFVLAPLADLAADRAVPGLGLTVAGLLEALARSPGDAEVVDAAVQDVDHESRHG